MTLETLSSLEGMIQAGYVVLEVRHLPAMRYQLEAKAYLRSELGIHLLMDVDSTLEKEDSCKEMRGPFGGSYVASVWARYTNITKKHQIWVNGGLHF